MKNVYLDSAATTQMREEVILKMTEVMKTSFGNPSSTHAAGRSAKSMIENARKTVASYLNVSAAEIVFTSGGTEADNLALNSAVRDLGVRRIITSKIEHHAVLYTVNQLQECFDVEVEYVNLKDCGSIDLDHLKELLAASEAKTLVSLMHVNNEVGNILDIKKVADLCHNHDALFHSDTVQSIGHFEMNLQEIPVDFTAVSAHKFHGPKGVGFAFIRKNSGLRPLIFGGEQERGFRAGTESVHNIVGLAEALKISYDNLAEEKPYITEIKNYFIKRLNGEFVRGTESWLSFSYLKTEENINNRGYISRPTDQRLKFGILFQDYVPKIPSLKMYLNLVYNTGLPGGSPRYADPYDYQTRLPDYRRADVGFSYVIVDPNNPVKRSQGHWLQVFKELSIGLEIFNLFDNQNSITNTFVRDVYSKQMYAIPNYLSPRVFNLRLGMRF